MNAFKRWILLLMVLAMNLSLTGCWDKIELEDRGFVVSLGIDKAHPKVTIEDQNRFLLSMALPNPKNISEGSDNAKTIKKGYGETITGAMDAVRATGNQILYFGHTKLIVLGEELLADEQLLRETADALDRNKDISKNIHILATRQEPLEVLQTEISGSPLLGQYISNFYKTNKQGSGAFIQMDLEKLMSDLRTTENALIPQIEVDDQKIILKGAAVVHQFKLAGWIDGEQLKGYTWMKKEGVGNQITTPFNGVPVPMTISENKCHIVFQEENGQLVCIVKIDLEGSISEYQFTQINQNLFNEQTINDLENNLAQVVYQDMQEVCHQFQSRFGFDGLHLKDHLHKYYFDLYKRYAVDQNWDEVFCRMPIFLETKVTIKNTGAIK